MYIFKCYLFLRKSLIQVIAAIGGFAYFMDKDGTFRNSFSDGWDRILSKHPIPFYYCIGKFYDFGSQSIFILLGLEVLFQISGAKRY